MKLSDNFQILKDAVSLKMTAKKTLISTPVWEAESADFWLFYEKNIDIFESTIFCLLDKEFESYISFRLKNATGTTFLLLNKQTKVF